MIRQTKVQYRHGFTVSHQHFVHAAARAAVGAGNRAEVLRLLPMVFADLEA